MVDAGPDSRDVASPSAQPVGHKDFMRSFQNDFKDAVFHHMKDILHTDDDPLPATSENEMEEKAAA